MNPQQHTDTQRCTRCRTVLDSGHFGVVIEGVRLDSKVCDRCVSADFIRQCRRCGDAKPLTEFGGCLAGQHLKMSICLSCCESNGATANDPGAS